MQQIDFHYNVKNRSNYACRLLKKITTLGRTARVWSRDSVLLNRVYTELWTFEDEGFYPHAWAGTPYASEAGIVFGADIEALGSGDVLVLLDEDVPPDWESLFARFDRVVDIVSTDPAELVRSRARYRAYKSAGVPLKVFDRRGN